jgi:2-(3-amino-3-carboxypropyl)histidine synthase
MLYACIISDILKVFSYQINQIYVNTVIMGDVTYGACCVDDIASDLMNCDLLIHYGHSCLVPITQTRRKVLYVFVEIQIDIEHFIETCVFNFSEIKKETLYLMSTIQFNNSLFITKQRLLEKGFENIVIPQEKPRSAG